MTQCGAASGRRNRSVDWAGSAYDRTGNRAIIAGAAECAAAELVTTGLRQQAEALFGRTSGVRREASGVSKSVYLRLTPDARSEAT
jgi:hypothetical protein